MSGMITVAANPEAVAQLLRSYPGARITELPGYVLSVGLGPENGFTITSNDQNAGANVHIADPDDQLDLDVYDFIAARTDWNLFLTGEYDLIDWRGFTPDELGLDVAPDARRIA